MKYSKRQFTITYMALKNKIFHQLRSRMYKQEQDMLRNKYWLRYTAFYFNINLLILLRDNVYVYNKDYRHAEILKRQTNV
jgi:hypothetical protein